MTSQKSRVGRQSRKQRQVAYNIETDQQKQVSQTIEKKAVKQEMFKFNEAYNARDPMDNLRKSLKKILKNQEN